MASKKLTRTTYRDPTQVGNPVRTGDASRGEAALDMDSYYRLLEQVHAAGVHGWGVAEGLRVTATLNAKGVSVLPGTAVDVTGKHVSLAEGGNAEIGPNADAPGTPPTLVGVSASGATVPTAGLHGAKYVTIQWWETFDTDAFNNYGAYRYNHTPWIRLRDVAGFLNDGNQVVLAQVTLDMAGNVTGLTSDLRAGAELPTGKVRLRKGYVAAPSPNFAVDNTASGEIRPRAAGGIEVGVAAPGDEINYLRDGGGNFAKLSVGADLIVGRRGDGRESVTLDAAKGVIIAGTDGVEGDILVKDVHNRLVITLDGEDATAIVGASGNPGDVVLKDQRGQDSIHLDGAAGAVWFRGLLRDPNNSYPGVGHDRLKHLKELTDGSITSLHRHIVGTLGLWGDTGTRVGLISAHIAIYGSDELQGGVTLHFDSHTFSNDSGGFRGDKSFATGFQGTFTATPHVMVAPRLFNLTTGYVFLNDWWSVDAGQLTVNWDINSGSDVWQAFEVLILGPIA
jgi:hypothetical protein